MATQHPRSRIGIWVAPFGALLVLNVVLTARVTQPAARTRIPFSPFFLQQVREGHVVSITSKGTAIQGTFGSKQTYGGSRPATLFSTEIPAFADTDALSLLGKQLHWTIAGPVFHPLHLQLDELVDSWRELSDSVAERAMTIGFTPDGQAGAIAAGSEIAALERTVHQDHMAVHELTRRVADVSERIRARMDRIGDLDLVSQDLLISVVGALEQQQWMLRSQFGVGGDGLKS